MSAQSRIRRSLRRTGPRRVAAALAAVALSAHTAPGLAAEPTSGSTGTTVAVANPAAPLPFDLAPSALRSSPKKAFAHYVPWFPVSHDNKSPDYYDRNFLTVNGEGGKHAAYGGYLRDRPTARPVLADSAYKLRDLETEVRQAAAAGLDGFAVDILQLGDTGGTQWTAVQQLLQAARNVDPGFKIMLMPDMTGTAMQAKSATTMAKYLAQLGSSPAAYKLGDGRLVVSPFTAERKTVAYWSSVLTAMRTTYGTPVAFLPLFQNEQKWRDAFDPISWGMSNWGSRNPQWNNPTVTYATGPLGRAAAVKALGQKWMQPVSLQDQRMAQGVFEEAQNTQNLRNTWQIARASGAELVQLPTWNDYAEGTSFAPSKRNGVSFLDLNAYYLSWWKRGTAPTVTRDAVYLTHRIAPHAALPTYAQTELMKLRGGSPARDTVEALTFLTAPATVKVTVGTTTTSCAAPAGVGVCTVPLRTGKVSASVERAGTAVAKVVSPATVVARPYVQDLQYVGSASGRQAQVAPPSPSGTSTTSTVQTVRPSEDTYANEGAPSTRFGTSSSLSSRGSLGAVSYLKLAIPAAPAGKTLRSAVLRLRTTGDAGAGSTSTHPVRLVTGSWSETGTTWSNRPALSSTVLGTVAAGTVPNKVYSTSLSTTAVRSWAGSVRTFAVASSGKDSLWVWSSEHANTGYVPQLVLTYS